MTKRLIGKKIKKIVQKNQDYIEMIDKKYEKLNTIIGTQSFPSHIVPKKSEFTKENIDMLFDQMDAKQ